MAALVAPERNLSRAGYFGPVTSTLDWCEANYQFSYYIAELANSLSSLWHVAFAISLMLNASRESLPLASNISLIGFLLVGLGSFAFHMTLLYEWQMSDEIPMIIFASMNVWATYDVRPGSKGVQGGPLLFLIFYIYRNPVYHQTVFAALMLWMPYRILYLTRRSPYASRISSDKVTVARSWYIKGVIVWLVAFAIWNLDNLFCDRITGWKVAVGWPAAFLLEGHSWWHFFTGVGTYYLFVAIQVL
ncbi:alkaline ceramidase ydc1 [Marasmius crinis-equi]|uniref:Alkaline ceramidase ydc1 n=1 Tax=Marasmius crinis-equi TaxID=585013 RepID=A0ABR3FZQ3_9AGAR